MNDMNHMREDPERSPLVEAQMILKGLSILPTKEHLEALEEHYDCQRIKLANQLEQFKQFILKDG